ncbi:helix-turn-helix domain-containing protein [Micromonospora sp. M12]
MLLAPLAARRLLGLPLSELTNRAVDVGQLPGRWLDRLRGQLAEAPGWPERFVLLDRVLAARLSVSPPVDARLDWAWRRLVASGGLGSVGALADELGWSRRHLASRFRQEVGLPPKMAARLLRFQQAYAALTDLAAVAGPGGVGDWAAVAAGCGYYDQSHLIRDFHQFAGPHRPRCSPPGRRRPADAGGWGRIGSRPAIGDR